MSEGADSYNSRLVDDYLFAEICDLKGIVGAKNSLLFAVLSSVLEKLPEMSEGIEAAIVETADLTERMWIAEKRSEQEIEAYRKQIKQDLGILKLLKTGTTK